MYDNFKSPTWKYFYDSYGYCAKHNFLATAHNTIILLLRISQIFVYCKSTYYFNTGNLLHIWLLYVEKLYENFKSPISKHINNLYGNCAKPILGYCASINLLLRISHLFKYCISTNYLTTGNRLHNCLPCIEKLYDNFKSPIWKPINDLYGNCAKHNFLATAHLSFSYGASPNYFSTAN